MSRLETFEKGFHWGVFTGITAFTVGFTIGWFVYGALL